MSVSIPYAVEPLTPALIRPGFAGPPSPQGKAFGKPCVAYVEKYRSNNLNVTKHIGFPLGVELSGGQFDSIQCEAP